MQIFWATIIAKSLFLLQKSMYHTNSVFYKIPKCFEEIMYKLKNFLSTTIIFHGMFELTIFAQFCLMKDMFTLESQDSNSNTQIALYKVEGWNS